MTGSRYRPQPRPPQPRTPQPRTPQGQGAPLEPVARGDARVLQGFAALRAERVFEEAPQCAACLEVRAREQDPGALCDDHLGQALGVHGGWDLGEPGKKL